MNDPIRIGPIEKIEEACPNTVGWGRLVIAGEWQKPNPIVIGAWSSSTHDGAITMVRLGVHDSPSARCLIWSDYSELIALPGSSKEGTLFEEIALINKRGSCADIDPFHIAEPGMFCGPRIGVGKPGSNGGEVSALATYLNVEGTDKAVARLGLVFHNLAVKFVNGLARVINLARNQSIQWWAKDGHQTSRIWSSTTEEQWRVGIEMANGVVNFIGPDGHAHFTFNCTNGALYLGSGALGPNNTIRVFVAGRPYLLKATPE